MGAAERLSTRISAYLTDKVREELAEDFHLIENQLPALIEKYSLRELTFIVRLEVARLKNASYQSPSGTNEQPAHPLA